MFLIWLILEASLLHIVHQTFPWEVVLHSDDACWTADIDVLVLIVERKKEVLYKGLS
jgi:hypothetical protein